MAEIKDRIITLRTEKNMSQSELANVLEISPSSIGMYEQGRRKPSYELLEKISDYFNVDMDYLMGRSDIKNRYQAGLEYDWEKDLKKLDTRTRKQYDSFMNEATLYFNDEKISIEDKQKVFDSLQDVFWEIKMANKRKK